MIQVKKKTSKSKWVVNIDKVSGEEHIYRVPPKACFGGRVNMALPNCSESRKDQASSSDNLAKKLEDKTFYWDIP